ncbi:hypothetical protein SUDANB150_01375 [Streptomyces sp. enrichment culture]
MPNMTRSVPAGMPGTRPGGGSSPAPRPVTDPPHGPDARPGLATRTRAGSRPGPAAGHRLASRPGPVVGSRGSNPGGLTARTSGWPPASRTARTRGRVSRLEPRRAHGTIPSLGTGRLLVSGSVSVRGRRPGPRLSPGRSRDPDSRLSPSPGRACDPDSRLPCARVGPPLGLPVGLTARTRPVSVTGPGRARDPGRGRAPVRARPGRAVAQRPSRDVRTRGPPSVMATVCSTCAAREPSLVRRVQPSGAAW